MRIKVRNIGSKSCGPFKIGISHYFNGFGGRTTAWDSAWSSGLKVDEEKTIVIYKAKDLIKVPGTIPPSQIKNAWQLLVDIDNTIDELNENNNNVDTKMSQPGEFREGIH